MLDEFPYDVFLSHSAKDKPVVRGVAERLKKDGLRVWFDEWEIRPGDSIPARIEEGLERSRVLVLCMSANAFGSDWAQLESGTFRFRDPLNKERRFLPLRLDDAPVKGSLAQFHYINWLPANRELDYPKFLEACRLNERHEGEHRLHLLPLLDRVPLVQRQISISYDQETELMKIFQLMPRVSVAVCSQMNILNDVSIKFAGLLMKAGVNVGQCALETSPLNQFPPGISVYRAEESVTITGTESIIRALTAIGLEAKIVPRPVWNDERGARFPLHVIFGRHP